MRRLVSVAKTRGVEVADESVKRNRLWAVLAALAIALGGIAWTGCGDDNKNDGEQVERGAEDAQTEGEGAAEDAQSEGEEALDDAQKQAEEAGDEAQGRLDDAKNEAEDKLDEATEEAERYLP
jgi:gas vesicle protein